MSQYALFDYKNYRVGITPHSWDDKLYQARVINDDGTFEITWNRLPSLDEAIDKVKQCIDRWDEL